VREEVTSAAEALLAADEGAVISTLTLLGTHSAWERKRKLGRIAAADVVAARDLLAADIAEGLVSLVPVLAEDFVGADALSRRVPQPIRTLDALHAAIARRLGLPLATFDQQLHEAAQADGVATRFRAV
jgi:predicted nucleic acid-binding protein